MAKVDKRMQARDIAVSFSNELRKFIAAKGYDPQYGARPLKRAIQTQILDPLAQEIIAGKIAEGGSIFVDVRDDKVVFSSVPRKVSGRSRLAAAVVKS